MLDKNAVEEHLKYFKEDKHYNEFYVALMLYEIYDLNIRDLNDKIIKDAQNIIDEYDSIYNDDLRERIRNEINIEREKEEELER